MREQHQRFVDEGVALSALTASEARIYGRFGYGPATLARKTTVDRRFARAARRSARVRPSALRRQGRGRAAPARPPRPLAGQTPGAVDRDDGSWDFYFLDRESWRDGASECHYVVHPDGYVAYRVASHWNEGAPAHEVRVRDFFAASPRCPQADLWRFLLGLDLAGPIIDLGPGRRRSAALPARRPPGAAHDQGVRRRRVAAPARRGRHAGRPPLPRGGPARRSTSTTASSTVAGGSPSRAAPRRAAADAHAATTADLSLGVGALGSIFLGAHKPSHAGARPG